MAADLVAQARVAMIDLLSNIKDILVEYYATPIFHALLGGVVVAMIAVAGLIMYFLLWKHQTKTAQAAPTTITAELSPSARNELLSLTSSLIYDLSTIRDEILTIQDAMATARRDITEIAGRVSLFSVGMDQVTNLRHEIDQLTRDNIVLNKKLRKRRASE